MSLSKNCPQCKDEFEVKDEDSSFLSKIAREIGGEKFEIPAPALCPNCRTTRRMAWRNERNLYKRKCSACGRETVSLYSPDKRYNILCQACFWSDKNNAMECGIDFDFSKSFCENFAKLQERAPRITLLAKNSENSEFTNHSGDNKDCYLTFIVFNSENVMYSRKVFNSRDIIMSFFIFSSERLSNCAWVTNGYDSNYCTNCEDISDCHFSVDLIGCRDCFLSSNLRNKQYYFRNEKLEKDEYLGKVKQVLDGKFDTEQQQLKEFERVKKNAIYKNLEIKNCENSIGDYLDGCKNCYMCYSSTGVEGLRYSLEADNSGRGIGCHDCMDGFGFGGCDLNYEIQAQAYGYHNLVNNFSYDVRESMYVDNCHNIRNCFGSIGLNRGEYCIFNKQYSKSEYEQTVPRIIKKMIETGEWGEFFPISLSPFGYNEAIASDFYPKEKAEASKLGAKWQDSDYSLKYGGSFYEPENGISAYRESEEKRKQVLGGVLKCSVSGKLFKVTPQELALYLKLGLPIPRQHYEIKFAEELKQINKIKFYQFYHRKCMNGGCPNEFETTYAPDRPERVFCESCYLQNVL